MAPPRHLVVTGVYRHVRNPMYVAVGSIIVGQALVLGSVALFAYTAIVVCAVNLFVRLHEAEARRDSDSRRHAGALLFPEVPPEHPVDERDEVGLRPCVRAHRSFERRAERHRE